MAQFTSAQLPHAKLDWIYPPGGQRGTQIEVTVGGADLDEGREFLFSHSKIVAKAKRTPADEFYTEGQPAANQFSIDIGADAPPGFYEAQLVGRHGLSTTRIFQVTDFAEVIDNGNNHTIELAQPLAFDQLVSGRTEAEHEDFYSIELAEGEEFTCEIWSRRIDSQAEIQIEICRADGTPLEPQFRLERRDPQLSFIAPAAGKYLLRVQDVTFRGGEPFFYRMAVHRQPVVHSVMPLAALPNVESEFPLLGNHLAPPATSNPGSPSDTQLPAPRLKVPGEFVGQFGPKRNTDWIDFESDAAGEAVIEVFSQRLGAPTDPFLTVSQVVKGDQGAETLKQIAEADRGEERPATPGYNITSEDPYVRLNLEKDAVYRIMLRDQNSFSRSAQSHVYRLAVRRPQLDFRLLVSPVSPWAADPNIPLRWPLTVRAGDALAIPVVAVRHDGFANDIVVTAEGLPPGSHCDPVTIRAGKTVGQLVIVTDEKTAAWVGGIRVVGESQVGETRARKVATPASLVWDTTTATFDRARLNQQLTIAVIQESAPISVRFDEATWEATPGGVVKAKMIVSARAELKEALSLAPIGLPDGVNSKFTMAEDKKSAELELTIGEKTAPGVYDLLVSGKPLVMYQNNPEAPVRAGEDQARIATLMAGFKSKREQLVAAAGAAADASSPEIKQLDEQTARGEAAAKEAAERATRLTAAAQPSERRSYVVSNVGTLHIKEKAKE